MVGATAAAGLALRLAILARSLDVLDRLFVSDDTYYTLSIARSIARGDGPAADGVTLTSGFQPLLGFLMAPVFRLGASLDEALRIDMFLLVVADSLTIVVLAWIAYRLAGPAAAAAAAAIWALSPLAITMSLGGLETALAVLLEASFLAAWIRARDAPGAANRWLALGVVAGLALLARVDAAILVAVVLAFVAVSHGLRRATTVAVVAGLVGAPWWLWCTFQFGSPIPTSGMAIHRQPFVAPWAGRIVSVAAGAVVSGPFSDGAAVKEFFFHYRGWGLALFVAVAATFACAGLFGFARSAARRDHAHPPDRSFDGGPVLGAMTLAGALLMLFYAWFGFSSYLSRYLAPVAATVTVLLAIGLGLAVRRGRVPRIAAAVLASALFAVAAVHDVDYLRRDASRSVTTAAASTGGLNSGYREAVRAALKLVPRGATAGAWQSGTLAYYADRRFRVVNLDGVVNPDAPDMHDDAAMARYIRDQRIEWLVDWSLLQRPFLDRGRFTLEPPPSWELAGTGTQSNGLRISVVQLHWDAAVKRYLADEGRALLDFALITRPLVSGGPPTTATCRRVGNELLARFPMRASIDTLVAGTPDDELEAALRRDVDGKYLLLLACSRDEPIGTATRDALPRMRDEAARIAALLSRFGVQVGQPGGEAAASP